MKMSERKSHILKWINNNIQSVIIPSVDRLKSTWEYCVNECKKYHSASANSIFCGMDVDYIKKNCYPEFILESEEK
jgi:hypothetical protein